MAAERDRQVPEVFRGGVIVAGGGVSGIFAALAAARRGVKTLLVDRFGTPGGNIGPGYIGGGSLSGYPIRHMFRGPFMGIPKEFIERHAALGGGTVPPYTDSHYLRDVPIATHVLLQMLDEAGVELLLSTFICDPVVEKGHVTGIFLENKSGRLAAKSRVIVDATGEADLSRRAGAPVIYPEAGYNPVDKHAPTGMGLWYVVSGVNWREYGEFRETSEEPSKEDIRWAKATMGSRDIPGHLIPFVRQAWEKGDFKIVQEIRGIGDFGFHRELQVLSRKEGLAKCMFNFKVPWIDSEAQGRIDAADGVQLSRLEAKLRMYVFELCRFWKAYVPGFQDSYLSLVSPYLGSRGGPCVEGDYTMSHEDLEAGRRFPDVLYIFDHVDDVEDSAFHGKWTDFPYRVMLPKGLEGILAVGRNASCRPDTLLRSRAMVMHMGEAAGTAAALSVQQEVTPRQLDVRLLQTALLDAGYYLGNVKRLRELGLVKAWLL